MNEVDGPPARLTAPGPPIHDFRTAPGSPSSSRRSSTSDPSHAARRLAALGLPPSGPVRLPETEHDAERLAAAEAEVRAHLRKRRRRRSLFLSPGTGRARPFAEESTPSTAVAATAASDPASRPPASAAALVPAPPQLPRIPSTAAARSSSSSLSASSSASSASPVSLAINDAAAGPSTPSPTTFNKIRRRRSTLTAATDVPWTPPSPLSATPGGGPLSSSKVGLKVRRALSLLAHGDGHEYAGDSPPRTSHPDGDQHHHHHHHHRSGQHRHPYQSVGASGTQDYLSRRESKRREKAEAEAHAAQQAAASAWLAERANSIAHNGGTASSTLEGPFSVLDSPYPYPAPGVRLEERTTDSPREAYLNRRESLLRNLRASLSVGNGSGTPTSASSRYGGGGGGALPAGVGGTAVGTIGEEPELERRLDGAFEAAADRRRRHERWREGLPTTMTATASTSRAGSPPATATPAGAGWLPDPPLARLDTPTSVYGGVDQGSSRWRGKTNPFDGSPGNGTGSGPGGGGGSGSFPLRAGSALGSPRPSFRSSPSAGSTSVFPPSNDEINGGRQTPPVNGGGRSSSPPLSTGLSPPVADRRRPSARRSVSPSFPRSASSATSSPALSRHNSFGPSNPTASGPGGLGGGGRRSPLGNEHLLPPIHLEAPTPLTGRTPHASPGRLAGGRELAPDRGDDGRVSGLVHSSPESIDGVFLSSTADGRLDGGAAAGDPSPGRSLLEDDRSPVGSASTLPFYPHQLQQRPPPAEQISSTTSLTNAARRKMLAALDTSAQIGPPAACGSASSGHRLLPTKSNDEGGATELADLARLTSDGPTGLGLLGTDDLELVDERLRSQRRPSVDAVSQSGSVARRPEGMALGQEGRHVVWERLWENQRGILFFGNPRFSARMLLPNEPANFTRPGLTKQGCRTPYNLRNFQLPDGAWEWASEWLVNMRRDGETDEKGWEYNSWFKVNGWHAVLPWHGYQGWVRRREWIRLRVLKPLVESATEVQSNRPPSRAHTPFSPSLFSDGGGGSGFNGRRVADGDDSSPVSPGTRAVGGGGYLEAATLQRWHYEPITLDEAVGLLASFGWDADRLRLWRAWLGERPGPRPTARSRSPASSSSAAGGESGILGLRALVEHHFPELATTFTSPVSRLRLQDLLRELHPDWRFTPPSW